MISLISRSFTKQQLHWILELEILCSEIDYTYWDINTKI